MPLLNQKSDLDNQYSKNPSACGDDREPRPVDHMEDLLADLDLEALPGTESDEEVIAEMTADDLEAVEQHEAPVDDDAAEAPKGPTVADVEPPAPAPTPTPAPTPAPAQDPAPNDPDSGMSFDSFQRANAFAAADEPDWFTHCISRGGPTSETLTEAEIADVEPPAPAPTPTPAPTPVWWIGPADDPDGLEWTLEAYERLCALADAKETTDWIAEVIDAEIAKKAAAEAAPAPPAPDPAPTPSPAPDVAPATGLTSDELEAVADLDRKPSDELSQREKIAAKARENVALLRNARAKKAAKAERDYEKHLLAKAERKREQDRARKNKQRARERAPVVEKSVEEHLKELESLPSPYPTPWRRSRPYTARLRALCVATANPRGDSFLVQIRGRELELTDGWVIELHARKKLGEKASLAAVARLHPDKSMTKRRVQSLRENIAKLEAIGAPWHGL